MLTEFINQYGTTILYALVTAIGGYIGIAVKNLYEKYVTDKTKRMVAKSAVQFVEQVYKELHGEQKLNEALVAAEEMLAEKGIAISSLELRVLVEAAVAEFNDAFKTGSLPEVSDE